jgi:ABC-2 type transport system ATP-binding protein
VVLSTHHTGEVAAFCQRVIVVLDGTVRFDGTPSELASVASGHVWTSDDPHANASRSWLDADGVLRSIGSPPPGATMLEPSIDDGYLLLTQKVATP